MDPRLANCVSTLHGFKHTVNKTRFAGTARLLASVSRDRSCRIFDLRTMKDMLVIRDSETDLSCVAWHPIHASMVTTAAYNGSISNFLLDSYIPDSNDSVPKGIITIVIFPPILTTQLMPYRKSLMLMKRLYTLLNTIH